MTTTKTKHPAAKPAADWSLAPRGVVSGTAQGALALAAFATAADLAQVSPVVGAAATVAGAVATVVRSAHLAHSPAGLLYRLCCWLGGGSWLTYTMVTTPWAQIPWAALGIGAVVAGILAPLTREKPRAPKATKPASTALVPRRYAQVAEEWTDRIFRCCNRLKVQVEDVREWPTKTGFSLLIALPLGGATARQLEMAAEGMANDARLPRGCGIEVVPGDLRGMVWMHVATVNRLAATIDHPGDYSGRSVNDGIVIGEYRNGEPMRLEVREPRAIVVGTTGSGKTVTLHVITAELGRCVDGLVWHMDLNGGGVSQPWLRPWLDGEVDRPAVDWAAPCPEEALLMSYAEVDIAKARKTAYSKRRMQADAQLLPVGPDVPQITTVLDEGFEVLSPSVRDIVQRRIRERIEETARIGRAEACQVLVSALRSTSNTLSTDLLSLLHNRIIMAGCEQKEIDYMYDYAKGPTVADLAGKGSGFARVFGSHEIRAWKAHFMKPARDIRPASLAISRTRPDLDAPSVAAAGEAYRTRLERMRWLFSTPEERATLPRPRPIELPDITDDRGNPVIWDPAVTHPADGADTSPASVPAVRPPVPVPAQRPTLSVIRGGADASAWADPRDITRPRTTASVADASAWADPARARLHAEQILPVTAAPAQPLPEVLRQALAAFDAAGDDRMHSSALADALGITLPELAALLRPLGVTALARAFIRGGKEARGYAREDLETAAESIRRGETEVPEEVAKWPAA